MKFKTVNLEVHSINPENLSLHPEALLTPKMNEAAYTALKTDIEINGQLDPVTVYRGKIVDGRHRWLILQELGIDVIKYVVLPNNYTLEKIRQVVHSKEMRRHETAAQLAIRAYRLYKDPKNNFESMGAAADAIGSNRKRVGEVKKIVELYGRSDIIEVLFDGGHFNTGTEIHPCHTDSLSTIANWLSEYGTIIDSKKKSVGISARKELTEDEQLMVNSYLNVLFKESHLVLENIAEALYSKIKGEGDGKN